MLKHAVLTLAFVAASASSYLLGAFSYPRDIWPIPLIRDIRSGVLYYLADAGPLSASRATTATDPIIGRYDAFGRLIDYPGKEPIACLEQTDRMAVILLIGQSNAANSGEYRFETKHPGRAFNYFDGQCYPAGSPLLGAAAEKGEFGTPMADHLIDAEAVDTVILTAAAIGSKPVQHWQDDAELNAMLLEMVAALPYRITHIIWHQGERDFEQKTPTAIYIKELRSLIATLRDAGVEAPFYVSVASKCGFAPWQPDNRTTRAQRQVPDGDGIRAGVDTDAMLTDKDRRTDNCHFSRSGLEKTARAYADILIRDIRD